MTRSVRALKSVLGSLHMHTRIHSQMAAAVLGLLASTSVTLAQNLVMNGDFESTTGGGSGHIGAKPAGFSLDDWVAVRLDGSVNSGSTSFALVGTMSELQEGGVGIPSAYGVPGNANGNLNLWGTSLPSSPTGGNVAVVEADWGWVKTELQQTINGLTVGSEYTVTFDWAAGQQLGFSGATASRWNVRLDGDSKSTSFANVSSQGFVGWTSETFNFTASSTTATLGFLAEGIGGSLPPFALLDNVRLTPVPEPSQYAAAFGGLVLVAGVARRLRAAQAK